MRAANPCGDILWKVCQSLGEGKLLEDFLKLGSVLRPPPPSLLIDPCGIPKYGLLRQLLMAMGWPVSIYRTSNNVAVPHRVDPQPEADC